MTDFSIPWDSQIFYTHSGGHFAFFQPILASFYQLLFHQRRKQALLLKTQMPLWSSVCYLHTPLSAHPVPNPRNHTNNEYMMHHPQQLLAVFLSDIWKIKRFITQLLQQHAWFSVDLTNIICNFLSAGLSHRTWLIQLAVYACNMTIHTEDRPPTLILLTLKHFFISEVT